MYVQYIINEPNLNGQPLLYIVSFQYYTTHDFLSFRFHSSDPAKNARRRAKMYFFMDRSRVMLRVNGFLYFSQNGVQWTQFSTKIEASAHRRFFKTSYVSTWEDQACACVN